MTAGRNKVATAFVYANQNGKLAPLEPGALATLERERPDVFEYVRSLHGALWGFIGAVDPGAGGNLSEVVPRALETAREKARAAAEPDSSPQFGARAVPLTQEEFEALPHTRFQAPPGMSDGKGGFRRKAAAEPEAKPCAECRSYECELDNGHARAHATAVFRDSRSYHWRRVMACTVKHHHELMNGVGKCSAPMWFGYGGEAGFCD
jgi:hypothetical protein